MAENKTTSRTKTVRTGRYLEAVGRRKTAIARVRLHKGNGEISVGEKKLAEYFPSKKLQDIIKAPFERLQIGQFDVTAKVEGGGISSQAEAIRLGIARALIKGNEDLKKQLRALGFMTRDARAVERKKPGLKKARKAPQWSKR